ncbi:prolyl oligopeptidase family serine peptidase, partial [Actinosynnema sp. NPDC023658]|uniref:prolyl oligopeptidase family serine peptidase n=1 Tax=Actinosynnema sp. NPDC023658 TaxID=3155465 RepID=UPI0033DF2F71
GGGPDPELLVLWSNAGIASITRHDPSSGARRGELRLPAEGVVTELTFGDGGDEAWFTYSDRVTPETVYRYRAGSAEVGPWRGAAAVDVPDVVVTTEVFHSADGTPVRLLLVRPGDAPPGPLPTVLQGYGAFGISQVPDYYAAALAWARRGGLFAVACGRGGGEHGEEWHWAGAREHKQRGITDFVSAAEHLVASGHAAPDALGAFGQSAGGLLVAAAMVRRPDLFAAVACAAAPLDMARYELTGLGPQWVEEFGSRNNPDELGWLLGYSPYHRLRNSVDYPAVLFATFEQDTRVDSAHSRKMCAAVQGATASGAPVLLRRDLRGGHGERDRSGRLAYFADVLTFFDDRLNHRP